jgi:ATP-dependent Clp protease ATP-binding subunit ClpX
MSADLRCSFCGKHQDEVKRLLAGNDALICNECVAVAARKMKGQPGDPDEPWPTKPAGTKS